MNLYPFRHRSYGHKGVMMQLDQASEFFTANDGSAVVFFPKDLGHGLTKKEITISPDGSHFYELQGGSGMYSGDHLEVSYTDKRNNIDYQIVRDGDTLSVNGKPYSKASMPTEIDFVLLPTIRKPEYLFGMPDGQVIYVSADTHHYAYGTFRLFIGPWDALREVQVTGVNRYRDGGTTYIYTVDGTLFSPTAFNREATATWTPNEGEPIELQRFDHTKIEATETDEGVTMKNPFSIPC